VPVTVTTSDPEDGIATACGRVTWTFGLGHDAHAHPLSQGTGCQFAIPTPADATQHGETENIFGVVVLTYTDGGANGVPAATTTQSLILNPKPQEAEWADVVEGAEITDDASASGLRKVTSLDPGDHLAWDPVNLAGISGVTARASGQGTLQLRWNSAEAAPFATVAVSSSGWSDAPTTFSDVPTGTGVLYVTSTGGVVLDRLTFVGNGVADVTLPTVATVLTPATPNGENGWYTSNVTVRLNATDNGTVSSRQYSTNGGTTWTTVSANNPTFTVSTEGTTTVLYRATDNGGNVSVVGELIIKIDKSDPTVSFDGATAGGEVGNAGDVSWTAADGVSGIQSVTATLDGTAVPADQAVELWRLTLGPHTVVATAEDNAGRTTASTLTFTTTSLAELTELTRRLADSGEVSRAGESQLLKRLAQAKKQADTGRIAAAVSQVEEFIALLAVPAVVPDGDAATALERDAREVIDQLGSA